MKTLNWNKIPNHKIVGRSNLWTKVAQEHGVKENNNLDFEVMEDLFCLPNGVGMPPGSPNLGRTTDSLERKKKESSEVRYSITFIFIITEYYAINHFQVYTGCTK